MASKLTIVLLMAAIVGIAVAAEFSLDTPKCKTSAATKAAAESCYTEETGKAFDKTTFKIEDLTATEKVKIAVCAGKKTGNIKADDTFDLTKAAANIDAMDAEPTVKEALKTGGKACVEAGGDLATILRCNKEVYNTNCK